MAKSSRGAQPHPAFIAAQVRDYRYFFLNLAPAPRSKLTVACGGWERCAPDYQVNRTDFGFYGLEYVSRGHGLLTVKGSAHRLQPGSIFAYRPLTPHRIQTDRDDPLVKYFIDFSGREAHQIFSRKALGAHGLAFLHQVEPIHDLFEQMVETGLKGGSLAPRICAMLLELLALRIEENAHAPSEAHGRARQSFDRCRGELHRHFRTLRSISELATRTHMDPAYLARLFDRFGSESPHEMLTRLKMNEAAAHLLGGRFTVKEVAAQVGFSDPGHFSRVFKKHHAISPARFQQARERR